MEAAHAEFRLRESSSLRDDLVAALLPPVPFIRAPSHTLTLVQSRAGKAGKNGDRGFMRVACENLLTARWEDLVATLPLCSSYIRALSHSHHSFELTQKQSKYAPLCTKFLLFHAIDTCRSWHGDSTHVRARSIDAQSNRPQKHTPSSLLSRTFSSWWSPLATCASKMHTNVPVT